MNQIAYLANLAFADALCNASENEDDPAYKKLDKDGFMFAGCELTHQARQYKMQKPFVDFAKQLLSKVQDNPFWQFTMSVAHDEGKRQCLYLLYCEAVGHGVGFWDSSNTWERITDRTDIPCSLMEWSRHFTHEVKYMEAPPVDVPRNARPWRTMP